MRLLSVLLVSLALLSGCATAPVVQPAAPQPVVVIEPDEREGFWRATYELSEPVSELRFERTPFRAGVFEVLTDGFTLERDGDADVLRTAGAPARRIAVRFPVFTRELEKEYDFFQKFTDGSVAIYTGHLLARTGPDAGSTIRNFRFVPPRGQHVVAGGKVIRGTAPWTDAEGEGAYVYFGSIEPVVTDELVALVDPGLPRWLWDESRSALPRLFDLYTSRLGVSALERPVVIFNYDDRGGSGYSMGGGTLPGQIQLTADGAAWKERSDDAFLQLFHFLAHESAHLWNGRVIRYEGTDDSWMHEGSADALTERTLRELGYLDDAAFLERQSEALNECRRKLGSFPLRDAAKRNAFPLYYSCGNTLALFTENAVAGRDLFAFWKALIARVRSSDRTAFDTSDYYAAMQASGASPEDVARLRRFAEETATADDLASMLRAKGLRLTEGEPSAAWGTSIARDALFRLLGEHCTGPYGFTQVETGLALSKTNSCGPLPAGGIVTGIGGHDVLRDGAPSWQELHERCGTDVPVNVSVTVDGTEKTIEVPCRKPVAAPIEYLKIEAAALPRNGSR